MKRARKVFRAAIVEGIGALIFLLIVAISLPNLLENSGLTTPSTQTVIGNERPSTFFQNPNQQSDSKQSGQLKTNLRQAIYEVPVTPRSAEVINPAEIRETFSFVDQPLYEVDTQRGPIQRRFEW